MTNTVISISNLSKRYRLGVINTGTFYGDLKLWWAKRRGQPNPYQKLEEKDHGNREGEELWALRDISFDVQQGAAIGIIGANGAGKSTLLKILSRVTAPTSGEIRTKGRISSLLEVGTGFHAELTGRENIYLNGAILGMSRAEVTRKFDEIVDFSGVEQFIDTPVKRYSSGMYVRLAFAVAAHLESEILIVDEVLAVGDADFRRKSLGKMGDVANAGRTVLFVSHNISAVNNLCQKGIVLEKGNIIFNGTAEDAVRCYVERTTPGESSSQDSGKVSFTVDYQKPIQFREISLVNAAGNVTSIFDFQESPCVRLSFDLRIPRHDYYASLVVIDAFGNWVYFTSDDDLSPSKLAQLGKGEYGYKVQLPAKLLKPGKYFILVSLTGKEIRGAFDRHDYVLSFVIVDQYTRRGEKDKYRKLALVAPEITWELEETLN